MEWSKCVFIITGFKRSDFCCFFYIDTNHWANAQLQTAFNLDYRCLASVASTKMDRFGNRFNSLFHNRAFGAVSDVSGSNNPSSIYRDSVGYLSIWYTPPALPLSRLAKLANLLVESPDFVLLQRSQEHSLPPSFIWPEDATNLSRATLSQNLSPLLDLHQVGIG